MKILFLVLAPFLFFAQEDAQSIIDKSIKAHGGKKYFKKVFQFEFRDKSYTYQNDGNRYRYTRSFTQNRDQIVDILSNDGFSRELNGQAIELTPKKRQAYSNSVNSVIYFAMLPHFLNDPAVHKTYLNKQKVKDQFYHKIQISFDQNGGGSDHDDIYVYWIHTKTYKVNYLAYSFHVNGGGVRFRSAYNSRKIDGIIFQDYVNYKADKSIAPDQLDQLYQAGNLKELSRIELKNIVSL